MSWLTDLVRPGINSFNKLLNNDEKNDLPLEDMWVKCPSCNKSIYHKTLVKLNNICPDCDFYIKLNAVERLNLLFDKADYVLLDTPQVSDDPLSFKDSKKYTERLKQARKLNDHHDAIKLGSGQIGGRPALVLAFEFKFMAGSMGRAVGEAFLYAAELAVKEKRALIIASVSGGARMQEGMLSLMQMARTTVATLQMEKAKLPYISLLTDPTTGGVSASFAMLGDVNIAEKGAIVGFAGARVIQQTIRETLPEGFQTAEYLHEHGMLDIVEERSKLNATIGNILNILMHEHAKPAVKEAVNSAPVEEAPEVIEDSNTDEVSEPEHEEK